MKTISEIKERFMDDLDKWENTIYQCGLNTIQKQPGLNQWSIGQVIQHFLIETNWYFSQARKAMADTKNIRKTKSQTIAIWLVNDSFPNKRFKGPKDLEEPHQPISINELIGKIWGLKNEISILANELSKANSNGKSEHPVHQFLTAREWFQYAGMHCRHHLRQKERIEDALHS